MSTSEEEEQELSPELYSPEDLETVKEQLLDFQCSSSPNYFNMIVMKSLGFILN